MEGFRDLTRASLARSLRHLSEEDRLAVALPAVCGSAMAAHCTVAFLDDRRTLHVRVDAEEWMGPLLGIRDRLQHDLARVAGVVLAGLHFEVARAAPDGQMRPSRAEAQKDAAALRFRRADSRSRGGGGV